MEIQKWEYKCVVNDWTDLKLDIDSELSYLGADGWELVTVVGHVYHHDGEEKQKQTFYFKRPLEFVSEDALKWEGIEFEPSKLKPDVGPSQQP